MEDIASTVEGAPAANGINGTAKGPQEHATPTASQATIMPTIPESKPTEPLPKQVEQFDELIYSDVTAFVEAAAKVGGLVDEQVSESYYAKELD